MGDNIRKLLEKVSTKIKYENKEKQKTAEDFNIFEILGVAHLEVSTHSAFIANLLNPKGSHSQGTKFLKTFLEFIGVDVEGFNLSLAQVEVEKHIGDLGRIDIFITDNTNWAIAIENKIYADLGEEQLGRYMRFLNKDYEKLNKKLVYLTLQNEFENIDSEGILLKDQGVSKGDRDKYHHITYDSQIIEWLSSIVNEEPKLPIKISEIINHYIQVIKTLTNKNNTNKMNNEIKDLISKNEESYNAYKVIVDSFSDLKLEALNGLYKDLKDNAEICTLIGEKENISLSEKIIIVKSDKLTEKNIEIRIEFWKPNTLGAFSIGLRKRKIDDTSEKGVLQDCGKLIEIWSWGRTQPHHYWYYFASQIEKGDILEAIYFHKDDVINKIKETIKICSS
ncbi:MAG: hypothetical protein E7035_08400 [Verrucomicrobiaceae bacterium]|nr:hypothetical protein [Verrucomicrobiaceae bacterium]